MRARCFALLCRLSNLLLVLHADNCSAEHPVAGNALDVNSAVQAEAVTDEEAVDAAMTVLRRIYGSGVPEPTVSCVTRWASDPYSRGATGSPTLCSASQSSPTASSKGQCLSSLLLQQADSRRDVEAVVSPRRGPRPRRVVLVHPGRGQREDIRPAGAAGAAPRLLRRRAHVPAVPGHRRRRHDLGCARQYCCLDLGVSCPRTMLCCTKVVRGAVRYHALSR